MLMSLNLHLTHVAIGESPLMMVSNAGQKLSHTVIVLTLLAFALKNSGVMAKTVIAPSLWYTRCCMYVHQGHGDKGLVWFL